MNTTIVSDKLFLSFHTLFATYFCMVILCTVHSVLQKYHCHELSRNCVMGICLAGIHSGSSQCLCSLHLTLVLEISYLRTLLHAVYCVNVPRFSCIIIGFVECVCYVQSNLLLNAARAQSSAQLEVKNVSSLFLFVCVFQHYLR